MREKSCCVLRRFLVKRQELSCWGEGRVKKLQKIIYCFFKFGEKTNLNFKKNIKPQWIIPRFFLTKMLGERPGW